MFPEFLVISALGFLISPSSAQVGFQFAKSSCYNVGEVLTMIGTYSGSEAVTSIQWVYSKKIANNLIVSASLCSVFGSADGGYPVNRMNFTCDNVAKSYIANVNSIEQSEDGDVWGVTFGLSGVLDNPDVVNDTLIICDPGTTTTTTTATTTTATTTITSSTTVMTASSTTATRTSSVSSTMTGISASTTKIPVSILTVTSTVTASPTASSTVTSTKSTEQTASASGDKALVTMIIVVSVIGGVLIVAIFSIMLVLMHWKNCFMRKGHSKQYAQRSDQRKQHRQAENNASRRFFITQRDHAMMGYYFYNGAYKNPLFCDPFENSSYGNNFYPNQKNSHNPEYMSPQETYQYNYDRDYNWDLKASY